MDMQTIIEAAGGLTKLARAVNRHHATVWGWRRVPSEHCQAVSQATSISLHALRPDVYPPPAPSAADQARAA